jgi:hypothetical protein
VKGKLALVREAGAERDVYQLELKVFPQEVLRSLNSARGQILVKRQPSGRLKLPRKPIGTEMGDGSHLLQSLAVGLQFGVHSQYRGAESRLVRGMKR